MSTSAPAGPAGISVPAPPPHSDKLDKDVLKISGVVVLGAIMAILDTTVVSVALPTFQTVFGVSPATAAWTMTAYTLALATVIPVTGWAADRFGTKRLYMGALTAFLIGSILCGLSWNITALITFRVLQGLGGGMLMPLGMTMLTRAAGPERVGRVMAVMGIPMLLGPILGPILGGWLIEVASWHWIFFINVPIGIVALISAWRVLAKDKSQPSEAFDFVGMLLLSPGLALFLYGVSTIPREGTIASAAVLVPAMIGVALILMFIWHAMRKDHPLIDLRLFRNRQLSISVTTLSIFSIAFFGAMLLFPSYFLQVRGETTLATGLLLAPQGIGAMITMPIAGRLTDKFGPGRFVLVGIVFIAAGMSVFTQLSATTPYPLLLGSLFVMGLGMGMTMMPIMSSALATLTHHTVARGSTLMNIIQQSAGSVGTAVMSVILTNQILRRPEATVYYGVIQGKVPADQMPPPAAIDAGREAMASAFGATFWVALVLVVLCLIPAFFLPRRKASLSAEQIEELEEEGVPAGPALPLH
jgi:EmrB/QacA subfamily drug resistance transporter